MENNLKDQHYKNMGIKQKLLQVVHLRNQQQMRIKHQQLKQKAMEIQFLQRIRPQSWERKFSIV